MATARITTGVVGKEGGQVMLPVANEQVTFTTSAQSAAFDGINMIRFIADADAYLAFGANPTAAATDLYVPSGTVEYFAVRPGEKVACYDGSS